MEFLRPRGGCVWEASGSTGVLFLPSQSLRKPQRLARRIGAVVPDIPTHDCEQASHRDVIGRGTTKAGHYSDHQGPAFLLLWSYIFDVK